MSPNLLDLTRRSFLGQAGRGLIGVALTDLLARTAVAAAPPHFPAKAKRVLHLFCPGAASHLDLWDYKPELDRRDGQPLPGEEAMVSFQGKNGSLMRPPWPFVPVGQNGKRISSMLPHLARHVDDMAFLHGM